MVLFVKGWQTFSEELNKNLNNLQAYLQTKKSVCYGKMGLLCKMGVYIRMTYFQNIYGDPCLSSLGLAVPTYSQNKRDTIGNTYPVTMKIKYGWYAIFFLIVLQNNKTPHF